MQQMAAILLPVFLMSACANSPVVLAPVGPRPVGSQAEVGQGGLRVYSATEEHAVGDTTTYRPHSGYTILKEDGGVFKYVPNHTGVMDEKPQVVGLPAGRYTVKAESEDYGRITVPVVIQAGRMTEVRLDWYQVKSPSYANLTVRLPDGKIVGWRATEAKAN